MTSEIKPRKHIPCDSCYAVGCSASTECSDLYQRCDYTLLSSRVAELESELVEARGQLAGELPCSGCEALGKAEADLEAIGATVCDLVVKLGQEEAENDELISDLTRVRGELDLYKGSSAAHDDLQRQLERWEAEVSREMPSDFKDWWQNSRLEHPLVARLVLESRRERADLADEDRAALEKQLAEAHAVIEAVRGIAENEEYWVTHTATGETVAEKELRALLPTPPKGKPDDE